MNFETASIPEHSPLFQFIQWKKHQSLLYRSGHGSPEAVAEAYRRLYKQVFEEGTFYFKLIGNVSPVRLITSKTVHAPEFSRLIAELKSGLKTELEGFMTYIDGKFDGFKNEVNGKLEKVENDIGSLETVITELGANVAFMNE